MSLLETIQKDAIKAAKSGNSVESDILKMLVAALKNAQIAKGQDEKMSDEEEVNIVFTESKKIRDSIEKFESAGRDDLAKREKEQLAVVEKYLPAQAEKDEIKEVVKKIIADTGASNMGNMGMVMGTAMQELQGRADGKVVSEVVKDLLS